MTTLATIKSRRAFPSVLFHSEQSSTIQIEADSELVLFQYRMLLETLEVFQEVELQIDLLNTE